MLNTPLSFHWRITLVGIGMGVFFPILSFSIDFLTKELPFSLHSVPLALMQNPIQWIILSAPLILGATFYFMGLLVKKREMKLEEFGENEAKQIAFIEKAFNSLEQGSGKVNMEELGSKSLSKAILGAIENMQKGKIEEEKRQWSASGFTKFNEILRVHNDDIRVLCEKTIGFMVQHVGALQGAAFVWNGDEKDSCLEFVASYACNNIEDLGKKFIPMKVL